MASTKLFSYNIEDTDGRLVVTVDGMYAKSVIDFLRTEVQAGRGWRVLSQISPAIPINRLARQAFWAQRDEESKESDVPEHGKLDLETIFKQGFAETYGDFAHGLERFGATLNELKSEFEANQSGRRNVSRSAGNATGNRKGGKRKKQRKQSAAAKRRSAGLNARTES